MALEENGEKNQVQLGKLEATIKSLSAELLKVCFFKTIEYFIGLCRDVSLDYVETFMWNSSTGKWNYQKTARGSEDFNG